MVETRGACHWIPRIRIALKRKYTLVSNCNYTDYALEGMEVTLPDSLKSRYTAKLVAEDNGDIAVEIARKSGLVIIMY